MKTKLSKAEVLKAIETWPCPYETEAGEKFNGMRLAEVKSALVGNGWRNVSHVDAGDVRKLGLRVVRARYIGGASPKRFADEVVVKE